MSNILHINGFESTIPFLKIPFHTLWQVTYPFACYTSTKGPNYISWLTFKRGVYIFVLHACPKLNWVTSLQSQFFYFQQILNDQWSVNTYLLMKWFIITLVGLDLNIIVDSKLPKHTSCRSESGHIILQRIFFNQCTYMYTYY